MHFGPAIDPERPLAAASWDPIVDYASPDSLTIYDIFFALPPLSFESTALSHIASVGLLGGSANYGILPLLLNEVTASSSGLSAFTLSLRPPAFWRISVAYSIGHDAVLNDSLLDIYFANSAGGLIIGSSYFSANYGIFPFNFNTVTFSSSFLVDLTT